MKPNYVQIIKIPKDQLKEIFNEAVINDKGNEFFNRFGYKDALFSGNYSICINQGLNLLQLCKEINLNGYKSIHKGTAYYWMGIAAFLSNDFQTANYLMDAAVSEDLRAGNNVIDNLSPALKFVLMRGDLREQAAQRLVEYVEKATEEIIRNFNECMKDSGKETELSLIELRKKFLERALKQDNNHLRTLVTSLISFILEFDYLKVLMTIREDLGSIEPIYIHLLKGCVLFESLLKHNPQNPILQRKSKLNNLLNKLAKQLDISNNLNISADSFQDVISSIGNTPIEIEELIILTGKIRNSLGHNWGWNVKLTSEIYKKLFNTIIYSILYSIACLY